MVFSNIKLLYRLIEADSQTGEDHLSLKTSTEPFIERGEALFCSHCLDAMEHTVVLGLFALNL
jgi:hypothetical protein